MKQIFVFLWHKLCAPQTVAESGILGFFHTYCISNNFFSAIMSFLPGRLVPERQLRQLPLAPAARVPLRLPDVDRGVGLPRLR